MLAALVLVLVTAQPAPEIDLLPTVATTSSATLGLAPPAMDVSPAPPLPEPRYYGWQPAAARGVGVLLLSLSLAVDRHSGRVVLASAGTLVSIGVPAALHGLHEQGNNTMLSLVGSVLSSGALGWLGLSMARNGDAELGLVLGVSAGQLLMAVVDATWLGYEDELIPMLGSSAAGTPTLGFVLAL